MNSSCPSSRSEALDHAVLTIAESIIQRSWIAGPVQGIVKVDKMRDIVAQAV